MFLSTVAIGLLLRRGPHVARAHAPVDGRVLALVGRHLWVEGFFEVFATAVISFLFVKLGLVRADATSNVLFATIVFMAGGVLGTLHHLYFAGTHDARVALGASFSRSRSCRSR
jgi:nitric oxide reductase subunit B